MCTKMEDCKYCRLCAERKDDLTDVTGKFGVERDLQGKISSCFNLDMSTSNPFPRVVCMDCCTTLETTWLFKETVEKAQQALAFIFFPKKSRSPEDPDSKVFVKVEKVEDQKSWFSAVTRRASVHFVDRETADFADNEATDFADRDTAADFDDNYDDFSNVKVEEDKDYIPELRPKKKGRSFKKNSKKIRRKQRKAVPDEFLIEMLGLHRTVEDNDFVNEYLHDVNDSERLPDSDGLLKPFKYRQSWRGYPWVCTKCGKRHHEVYRLRKHWDKIHKEHLDFNCADCDMNIRDYFDFVTHVRTHPDRKHLKFCCDICLAYYESTEQLNEHRFKAHTPDKPHLCHRCWAGFSNASALHAHGGNDYKCGELKKEIYNMAEEKDKNSCVFLCEICNKTFKSKGNLAIHTQIHTERSRDHTCDKCGKAFYNKGTLTSHLLQHEEARPYKCLICGAGFKSRPHLRNHAGVHVTIKPFSCDQCGRCFRLRQQLRSHMIIHTDALPHVCTFCNKAFRFKTILTQHLRQHTGAKPYNCNNCQRDFTNWPNYNKHMKRRHGIDTAKKKFTSLDSGLVKLAEPNDGKLIILLEDPASNEPVSDHPAERNSTESRTVMSDRQFNAAQTTFRIL